MKALLIVLDSVGLGGAPDAADYGDQGADTLGHVLIGMPGLSIPTLRRMGLGKLLNTQGTGEPQAAYGIMQERSTGKDSTTGHWEIAGIILKEPFATFEAFPDELVSAIEKEAGVHFLANKPASGTAIIEEFGPAHLQTGQPILYTSADSVLQIAAHEEVIPPSELYRICEVARKHADAWRIGRVIARPFAGAPGSFKRTSRRHDFSMRPPYSVLNALQEHGWPVCSVGKVDDLFAGSGISESHPTASNEEGMQTVERVWNEMERGLLFANLVDFDTVFGHRRDVEGYGRALEQFDAWLKYFLPQIKEEDLLIITADHGNDPTWRGTDHTRERVPLLVKYNGLKVGLGCRSSFADIAATLSGFFRLPASWPVGESFL